VGEVIVLAFALSMDAFAVSIGLGSKQCALVRLVEKCHYKKQVCFSGFFKL